MERTEEPKIYEWQVLPFGTTCSPCCAIHALQWHVQDKNESNSHLVDCVEKLSTAPTQRRKRRILLMVCASYSTLGAPIYARGLATSRQSLNIFHPTSDPGAVSYGFPNPAWTFRSELLGYNGIASVTPRSTNIDQWRKLNPH